MRMLVLALFAVIPLHAKLWMPSIFDDGMVLQAAKPVPVWGWANPGERVTVRFDSPVAENPTQEVAVQADAEGKWTVVLDPLEASSADSTLTVFTDAARSELVMRDVRVGEVWILAGQSNMGWPLARCDGGKEAAAEAVYPWLRIFKQWPNHGASDEPARDVTGGQWTLCTPDEAPHLSGVGFFFARELVDYLPEGTPVALINTQMGGTYAECWIDLETLQRTPTAEPFLQKAVQEIKEGISDPDGYWGIDNFRRPSALFNGKVAPLQPLAVRGVIWYQGEGNAQKWLAPGYRGTLTALIQSWRRGFEDPALPFLVVQLPSFSHGPGNDWNAIRSAQAQVARDLDAVELIVTLDCGQSDNIHPPDKQPISERLARRAAGTVYILKDNQHEN